MATRTLTVNLVGRTKNLERAFDRTSRSANSMAGGISKAVGGAGRAMLGLGAVFAGGAVAAKQFVDVAVDVEESLSKNTVVFGESAAAVEEFANSAAESLGMSRRVALEATGTFGTLAAAMKLPQSQAAEMSTTMTALAADMASFNNASPEETLLALQSGLRGEAEPLRRFGVLLDAATLKQEALAQGLIESDKTALTPVQKALAAYSVILEQTKIQQGDFERTSDGLANQQRILNARLDEVKETLGLHLLPLFEHAVSWLSETGVPAFEAFAAGIGDAFDSPFVQAIGENLEEVWERITGGLAAVAGSDWWGRVAGAFDELPGWARDALEALDAIDWSEAGLDEIVDVVQDIFADLEQIITNDLIPTLGELGGEAGGRLAFAIGEEFAEVAPGVAFEATRLFDQLFKTNFQDLWGDREGMANRDEVLGGWFSQTGLMQVTRWFTTLGLHAWAGFQKGLEGPESDAGTIGGTVAGELLRARRESRDQFSGTLLGDLAQELFGKNVTDLDVGERAEVEAAAGFIGQLPDPIASSAHSNMAIVVNMPPGSDGDDVVNALSRWAQQNGPLPPALTGVD